MQDGFTPFASRSLGTSTSWAVGGHATFPGPTPFSARGKRWTPAGLTGAHFPDGRLRDYDETHYNSLREARQVTGGVRRDYGTLHAHHVNLESVTGRILKQQMELPFREHSRVDSRAAALQAWDVFQQNGVRILRGYDHNTAFEGVNPLGAFDLELWAHGETGNMSQFVANAKGKIQQPIREVLKQASLDEDVTSVLIRACNEGRHVVGTTGNGKLVYGFGLGYNAPYASQNAGAVGWTDAVVIVEGGTTRVFPREAVAEAIRQQHGKLELGAADQLNLVHWDASRTTELRLNVGPAATFTANAREGLRGSISLASAPHLVYTEGGYRLPTGDVIESFEDASARLLQTVRGSGDAKAVKTAAAEAAEAGAKGLLSRFTLGGLNPKLVLGGLAAGGLVLGLVANGGEAGKEKNPNVSGIDVDRPSGEDESETTRRLPAKRAAPGGRTHVRISDHPLNMTEVDRAFAHKFEYGYAYS